MARRKERIHIYRTVHIYIYIHRSHLPIRRNESGPRTSQNHISSSVDLGLFSQYQIWIAMDHGQLKYFHIDLTILVPLHDIYKYIYSVYVTFDATTS